MSFGNSELIIIAVWGIVGIWAKRRFVSRIPTILMKIPFYIEVLLILLAPLTLFLAIGFMLQERNRAFGINEFDGTFVSHDIVQSVATDASWKVFRNHHMFLFRKTGPAFIDVDGHEEYCPLPMSPLMVIIESDGTILTGNDAMCYYLIRKGTDDISLYNGQPFESFHS